MQEVKIRTSANLNLWPELWRREWHSISMKMAETSSSGPPLARARFGPLERVSAIFIEVECHSVLHSSGHKLGLAEVLIVTSCMVKYNLYFFRWQNILIF